MFGFNKKKFNPSVTPENKEWVENKFLWFIEIFGLEHLKEGPFILPTNKVFPYDNLNAQKQFQELFIQLCQFWQLNPENIHIEFFDDLKSKEWTTIVPEGNNYEPSGIYFKSYSNEEKPFNIQLAKSNLQNFQLLVTVISHELSHIKLLEGGFIQIQDNELEPLTDLACIFFGFGVFLANSSLINNLNWISRTGYLSNELISYSNALMCHILKQNSKEFYSYFNSNTISLFKQDSEFLINTGDTILTQERVKEHLLNYQIRRQIDEGFSNRDFNSIIKACNELLQIDPNNITVLNDLGYALLQQKKYSNAIEYFDKSIKLDPFWDFPINNRGYCKLQLGLLDNAFADISRASEMNPQNPFVWRNLGAYYLKINEHQKALFSFKEAEKIDPSTELLNFYLGHVYEKCGDISKSNLYFQKSKELNEYNDSTIGE